MKGYCPCCKVELVPARRSKKKCTKCGRAIYVRAGQLLPVYDSDMKDLIGRG